MKGPKQKRGKLKGKAAKRAALKESRNADNKKIGKAKTQKDGPGSMKQNAKPTRQKRDLYFSGNLRSNPVAFVKDETKFELKFELGTADLESSSEDEEFLDESSVAKDSAMEIEGEKSQIPTRDTNSETPSSQSATDNTLESLDGSLVLTEEARHAKEEEEEPPLSFSNESTIVEKAHTETGQRSDLANASSTEPINSDEELLGSMDDQELDRLISEDVSRDCQRIELEERYLPPAVHENDDPEIDSDSETDYNSSTEQAEQTEVGRATEPHSPPEAEGSSEDEGPVQDYEEFYENQNGGLAYDDSGNDDSDSYDSDHMRITLDDYDLSDADSAVQDYMDNMSDLDDDQIFALASGQTQKNGSVHDFEDMDIFDKYDEYDEYFDNLLGDDLLATDKKGVSDRKKVKRQARQALHAMKFGKEPPLWQQYPTQIHVREVLAEVKSFAQRKGLHGEGDSLSFPPLDSNANWYVKQLAEKHGMSVTVTGSDLQKYVRINRTKRTNASGGDGLNRLLTRRQVFRRSDLEVSSKKRSKLDGPGNKEKTTGGRIRHGYVVGQDASQINEENFGHRLLRQMGWTEGSGLGKERAGITAPIGARVKLTKTGLGGV